MLATLFADDTNVFLTGKNIHNLLESMNVELQKVVIWLNANKLSSNVEKSHFMLFINMQTNLNNNDKVYINGKVAGQVKSTKCLVYIDDKMTRKQHIHYIKGKISRGIGILCKARKVLNQSALLNLYYSLLYPYFTYGIEVWGSTFQAHINCLTKLQKKIEHIITN